jgi:hypothetical protein
MSTPISIRVSRLMSFWFYPSGMVNLALDGKAITAPSLISAMVVVAIESIAARAVRDGFSGEQAHPGVVPAFGDVVGLSSSPQSSLAVRAEKSSESARKILVRRSARACAKSRPVRQTSRN